MRSIVITLVLVALISMIGALGNIYDFFQFLYINFSFPLLILVVIIVFKKELRDLINRVSKITYGNNSIELDFVELRKKFREYSRSIF